MLMYFHVHEGCVFFFNWFLISPCCFSWRLGYIEDKNMKKQCQILLRLLGWNDQPATPIRIQACAVAASEKLSGAQMSWLSNVPEMELYGVVESSGIPRNTPKVPFGCELNKDNPFRLGHAMPFRHTHTQIISWKCFQKCWPEQSEQLSTGLPLCPRAQFKQKKQLGVETETKEFQQQSWLQIPDLTAEHPSIPDEVAKPLLQNLAFRLRGAMDCTMADHDRVRSMAKLSDLPRSDGGVVVWFGIFWDQTFPILFKGSVW